MLALTREISPAIANCELTHLPRAPIDAARARAQHAAYENALESSGCRVERLPTDDSMPDSVFIEDTAVVLDELAVLMRPGAESRRAESVAVERALSGLRALSRIEAPGTLDGGDVLVAGKTVFVGRTVRSNEAGIRQFGRVLAPHGYSVVGVEVSGCLHLKSAVTSFAEGRLLINPAWVERSAFPGFELLEIDPAEPYAANVLRVGDFLLMPSSFPGTRERLARAGVGPVVVDADELAKAEGAVTCCSLLVRE